MNIPKSAILQAIFNMEENGKVKKGLSFKNESLRIIIGIYYLGVCYPFLFHQEREEGREREGEMGEKREKKE